MTKEEFKVFVENTIEEVIRLAEKESMMNLPRTIAFKWLSQKEDPIKEHIADIITERVYVDEEHIYPCVDIGVADFLSDRTVLLTASVAGYPACPFQKNRTGRDGPFVYIIGQKFLDKYRVIDEKKMRKRRQEIVRYATALKNGTGNFLDAIDHLNGLRFEMCKDSYGLDPDFIVFVIITDEVDHIPREKTRALCTPEWLKKCDEELEKIKMVHGSELEDVCSRLIARYGQVQQ